MSTETVDAAGWYQVITAFPDALTTVAYLHESGDWWLPDPGFNEASVVGARISRLYTEEEVAERIVAVSS